MPLQTTAVSTAQLANVPSNCLVPQTLFVPRSRKVQEISEVGGNRTTLSSPGGSAAHGSLSEYFSLRPHTELLMRQEASRRQVATINLLLEDEGKRLLAMNTQAYEAIAQWNLVQRFKEFHRTAPREMLESCGAGELSVLISQLDHPDLAITHSQIPVAHAKFVAAYPRLLLRDNFERDEVESFAEKLRHVQEQIDLLELLQVHEAKSLSIVDKELSATTDSESSPHRTVLPIRQKGTESGDLGVSGVAEPLTIVIQPKNPPPPQTVSVAVQEPAAERHPTWYRWLPPARTERLLSNESVAPHEDPSLPMDERLCAYIQHLQDAEGRAISENVQLKDANEALNRQLRAAGAELESLRRAVDVQEQDLECMRDEALEQRKKIDQAAALRKQLTGRLHSGQRELIYKSEFSGRQFFTLTECAERSQLEMMFVQGLLAESQELAGGLKVQVDTLQTRVHDAELKAELATAERESMELERVNLQEQLAELGADRALLRVKLEKAGESERLECLRSTKLLQSAADEIAALKATLQAYEIHLDVLGSTQVSTSACAKAVDEQIYWDNTTNVKPKAAKTKLPMRVTTTGNGRHHDPVSAPRPRANHLVPTASAPSRRSNDISS